MAETDSYSSALGLTSGSFARKSCHFLFHQERRIPLECSYSLLPMRQHFSDGPHLPLPPGWGGHLHLSKCTCFMLWNIIGWTMELLWIYMRESSHNPSSVCGIGPWIWEMTDKYFSKHLWFQNSGCCWNVSTSENGNFTRKWKEWAAFDGQGSNVCILLKFLENIFIFCSALPVAPTHTWHHW